jgi:hypothetical protein
MLLATLTVDGREHRLPPDMNTAELTAEITEQVRAGGGFVEIQRDGDRSRSIFVTPALGMSIDVREIEEDHQHLTPRGGPAGLPSFLGEFDFD